MRARSDEANIRRDLDRVPIVTSTFIDVDEAMVAHLINLELAVNVNGQARPVTVVFDAQERWVQAQSKGYLTDEAGKPWLPLLLLNRTGESRDSTITINNEFTRHIFHHSQFSAKNPYDRYSQLFNEAPRREIYEVQPPQFYMVSYEGLLWTEYIYQLNPLKEKIGFYSPTYWGVEPGRRYVTILDDFSNTTEVVSGEDRMVKSSFTFQVRVPIVPGTIAGINTSDRSIAPTQIVTTDVATSEALPSNVVIKKVTPRKL